MDKKHFKFHQSLHIQQKEQIQPIFIELLSGDTAKQSYSREVPVVVPEGGEGMKKTLTHTQGFEGERRQTNKMASGLKRLTRAFRRQEALERKQDR